MSTNKEVKIALIIGMIMITLCAIILISNNSSKKTKVNTDIKVYKHIDDGTTKGFIECYTNTDDIIFINNEYKKTNSLNDNDKYAGRQLNANYKITNGDDYIAFDDNSGFVWRGYTQAIYYFESPLYDYVINLCK